MAYGHLGSLVTTGDKPSYTVYTVPMSLRVATVNINIATKSPNTEIRLYRKPPTVTDSNSLGIMIDVSTTDVIGGVLIRSGEILSPGESIIVVTPANDVHVIVSGVEEPLV